MEQHYHNAAIIPISLEKLLFILHLVRAGLGILLLLLGIGTVVYYDSFLSCYVLVLGLSVILSGVTGFLATKFKSLAGHGGCVGTSAVTLYLGIITYSTSIGVATTMPSHGSVIALLLCDVLLIAIDLVLSALSVGMEAVVLYISTTRPA